MSKANFDDLSECTVDSVLDLNNIDIVIRNARILTMDMEQNILSNGTIAINEGLIIWIGSDSDFVYSGKINRNIDAHSAVVHPGFIDTHVHLIYHTIRRFHDDCLSFEQAMSFHGGYLSIADDKLEHAGTRLACLEMARNGTTCFLEANVISTEGAVSAIREVGLRAMIGDPVIKDIVSPGERFGSISISKKRSYEIIGNNVQRYSDPNGLVHGVVTLSGMGSASDELLLKAKEIADRNGVILNMHQSYSESDTKADDKRLGKHPLVHYDDIGLLGPNCTFSHMNFVREDEFDHVVDSGMSVAWCPIASMMYGIGGTIYGRHLELYKAGSNIALGSDSANWTTSLDVGDQALMAVLTSREKTGDPKALSAYDVLKMSTVNGARAVGMAEKIGSLEIGKKADIVIRNYGIPEAIPYADPVRTLIYSTRSKNIDTVIVNGEVIIEKGHSARLDEEELFARVREASRDALLRMENMNI